MFKFIRLITAILVGMLLFSGCGSSGDSDDSDDIKTPLANSTDSEAPKITMSGKSIITIVEGTTYTDAGATAKDNFDSTVKVVKSGSVDSSKVGIYIITYTAIDKAGNKSTKTREVKVISININTSINDGLIAYYKFNGNANDSSKNGNNGIEYGAINYTNGISGEAVSFEGYNQNRISFLFTEKLQNFTFSFFARINSLNGSKHLFTIATPYQDNHFLLYYVNSSWVIFIGDEDNKNNDDLNLFNDASMDDMNFHHVAISRFNNKATLYIDGKKINEVVVHTNIINLDNSVILGQEQDCFGGCFETNQRWNGLIDDLRIYTRALDQSEIKELYEVGNQSTTKDKLVLKYTEQFNNFTPNGGDWDSDGRSNKLDNYLDYVKVYMEN